MCWDTKSSVSIDIAHTGGRLDRWGRVRGPLINAYLDAKVASVNVISQEEIPCGGRVAADLEEFHQVVLVMNEFMTNA